MKSTMEAVVRLLTQKEVMGPLIAACSAVLVFLLGALTARNKERRQRRQEMYAEAYKAVLSWREMTYRVRRRQSGDDAGAALMTRFHELQEQIDYYQGWIATESVWVGRSFCKFAAKVKAETRPLLVEAWEQEPQSPGTSLASQRHPDIQSNATGFLFDVRAHLSPWFHVWTKIPMVCRNIEWKRPAKPVPQLSGRRP